MTKMSFLYVRRFRHRIMLNARMYLTLLLLFLGLTRATTDSETATFATRNVAIYSLLRPPNISSPFVKSIELEFRTSQQGGYLLTLESEHGEELSIMVTRFSTLTANLNWLLMDGNSSRLVKQTLNMSVPPIANGEWHRLTVQVESGGQLVLDGEPLVDRLPSNFTTRFPYNDTSYFSVGINYRGCFSNVSLDGAVRVPLYLQSELLNKTEFLKPIGIRLLPNTGPGCRQSPCICEPNGVCIYRQWDLFDQCNCTRGYDEASLCKLEWNTCTNLETGPPCHNGGTCVNKQGIDEFLCFCPREYIGSWCQNANPCSPQNPCLNEGTCLVHGDPDISDSISYSCICAQGFQGKNCSEVVRTPDRSDYISSGLVIGLSVALGVLVLNGLIGAAVFVYLRARSKRMNSTHETGYLNPL